MYFTRTMLLRLQFAFAHVKYKTLLYCWGLTCTRAVPQTSHRMVQLALLLFALIGVSQPCPPSPAKILGVLPNPSLVNMER